jgi:hypothetical protein
MTGKITKIDQSRLPTLSQKELRDLRARIDFLLQGDPAKTQHNEHHNGSNGDQQEGREDPALMVLAIIHRLCRERGLDARDVSRLKGSSSYASFAGKVPDVLNSLGKESLSTIQLQTILRLGMALVLDQITSMGIAASASVLMGHVHRLPGVLDQHFPGYRQAGLLKLIARGEHE